MVANMESEGHTVRYRTRLIRRPRQARTRPYWISALRAFALASISDAMIEREGRRSKPAPISPSPYFEREIVLMQRTHIGVLATISIALLLASSPLSAQISLGAEQLVLAGQVASPAATTASFTTWCRWM